MKNCTFRPFQVNNLPLLFEWLSLPHVREWWKKSRNYDEFSKKYRAYIDSHDVGPYLICHNQKPIGYIAWYDVAECPVRNEQFPQSTYGFDTFIADPDYLGKGYGQTIIKQFIATIIMPLQPTKIIVDPEIANKRAIHVYEKVGFRKTKLVETTDGNSMVMAQLMELDVERAESFTKNKKIRESPLLRQTFAIVSAKAE